MSIPMPAIILFASFLQQFVLPELYRNSENNDELHGVIYVSLLFSLKFRLT